MIIERKLCSLLYKSFTTPSGYGKEVVRCIPKEGVHLYEVKATYAKQVPSATYYFLGRTTKEVIAKFKNTLGAWMKMTSVRVIPPGDEAESILTDKLRMPMS